MNNPLEKTRIGDDSEADIAPKVFGFAALGVMAAMFALMGFSMTIIIFLVLVGYFVWRAVARTEMHEVRGIFEFYLSANEILRDDERRWYGFEIQDVINRGQKILTMMPDSPPLVHFALGALHHRAGNYSQAENYLAFLVEEEKADERNRLTASSELRSYVRILRKLEREPAEAPQTTAAIRALERSRRHRAAVMLAESRQKTRDAIEAAKAKELLNDAPAPPKELLERLAEEPTTETESALIHDAAHILMFKSVVPESASENINGNHQNGDAEKTSAESTAETTKESTEKTARKSVERQTDTSPDAANGQPKKQTRKPKPERENVHKSITEVLRDIYD